MKPQVKKWSDISCPRQPYGLGRVSHEGGTLGKGWGQGELYGAGYPDGTGQPRNPLTRILSFSVAGKHKALAMYHATVCDFTELPAKHTAYNYSYILTQCIAPRLQLAKKLGLRAKCVVSYRKLNEPKIKVQEVLTT